MSGVSQSKGIFVLYCREGIKKLFYKGYQKSFSVIRKLELDNLTLCLVSAVVISTFPKLALTFFVTLK